MLSILGGTFDPIHFGHLRTQEVTEHFNLSDMRLIPGQSAASPQPQANPEQRLEALQLALAAEPVYTQTPAN